jgi:chemotaxis signal transduction protein
MALTHVVLPFELRGTRFAIPAGLAVRVFPSLVISPLPSAPNIIIGICQIHGRVLPVIDLCARLGWTALELGPWSHWIWLRTSRREMLLPVDRTEPVRTVRCTLDPVASIIEGGSSVKGVLQAEDGFYLLQDVELFLTSSDEQSLNLALTQHANI